MKKTILTDTHGGNPLEAARRLGLASAPSIELDFSVNLNPIGPPAAVNEIMLAADFDWSGYPDPTAAAAETALAQNMCIAPERLILCNGATEALLLIAKAFKARTAAWLAPSYSGYWEVCAKAGVHAEPIAEFAGLRMSPPPTTAVIGMAQRSRFNGSTVHGSRLSVRERKIHHPLNGEPETVEPSPISVSDLVFIGNPNNPTGSLLKKEKILRVVKANPKTVFVVDESFMDFVDTDKPPSLLDVSLDNLVVLKSLTKVFSIAGVRLGAAVSTARNIAAMRKLRLPWSVNAIAQRLAGVLYTDARHLEETRKTTTEERSRLMRRFSKLPGIHPCDSATNFILLECAQGAEALQKSLLRKGVLVRCCASMPGLDERFIRIAVKTPEENGRFIDVLEEVLTKRKAKPPPKRAKAIMVVGTMSNSGKSWMASALCRHFARQGLKVAPFKAQNMALNSFVTKDGGEIGRAQALQARAARVEPTTDMNPVLLKPTGEARSQVIVDGKPWGDADARGYYARKKLFKQRAFEAYDRLAADYDLIVIEGAGSPAEINLLDKDFVNMAMARHAEAHTILVADIDRGGVFASIFGTVQLIPPELRRFLSGVVINKFRGDPTLLTNGIETIQRLVKLPVLGVIPHRKDIHLEEEDSLGLEGRKTAGPHLLDIVVVKLPRLSNYTDFLALEQTPGVRVRYEDDSSAMGKPDLIMIPGSKNTLADLEFLKTSGWAGRITSSVRKKIPVIGLCGGYQMLGEKIADPHGVESAIGSADGLGLLPVKTTLANEKQLSQTAGKTVTVLPFAPADSAFTGYEIHMGVTEPVARKSKRSLFHAKVGSGGSKPLGAISDDGLVFGTYVHGFFDEAPIRHGLLRWLCGRKGIDPSLVIADATETGPDPLDLLADHVANNVDMKTIESWIKYRSLSTI